MKGVEDMSRSRELFHFCAAMDVEIICRIGNCLDCSPAIAESIYEKADELSLETKYSMERVTNDICKIYRVYGYEFLIDMTGDAYLGVIYDLSNK